MKTLYKYNLDCGRMGDIDGIFVADDADVLKTMGKHASGFNPLALLAEQEAEGDSDE